MSPPRADLKTKETAPQFAQASGGDDGLDVPSKPIRDPSLDTLLEGLEERLDQGRGGAKLRVHTPPNAHTDPFPEEPVVAPNLTAPLSALTAQKKASAERAARVAPAPPRHDPTFVLDREPTMTPRSWLVVAGSGVVVAGAIAVAIWVARGSNASGASDAPRAEAAQPQAALSVALGAPAGSAVSAVPAAPTPVVSAAAVAPPGLAVSVHSAGKPAVQAPAAKPSSKSSSTSSSSTPPGSGDLIPVPFP